MQDVLFFLVLGCVMCPFLYLVQGWQSKASGQPFVPASAWRFAITVTLLVMGIALVMTWWDNTHKSAH